MAAEAGRSSSLVKHAKFNRFDPTKQTSFRQWMSTLKAAVSEGAAASLRYGKPTREQVRRLANIPAGDEAALNDAYALMLQNYMHYQEEVWRVLILYTDFSSNITDLSLWYWSRWCPRYWMVPMVVQKSFQLSKAFV